MKKIISLVIVLFAFTTIAFPQVEMVKTSALDGRVELLIPKNFKPAKQTDKTTVENEVTLADESGKVNLTYSLSDKGEAPISDNDIPAYTDVLLSEMKKNKMGYKQMEDGIHLQDGKNIGYIKFIFKSSGEKLFTYLFYISVEDRVLSFAFTSPAKQRKQWEQVADTIANSLRVVK